MSDDSKRDAHDDEPTPLTPAGEESLPARESPDLSERPAFLHPQWMVGVVLILGVGTVMAGLANPIWFVIGFPFVLVLVVWLWVRLLSK